VLRKITVEVPAVARRHLIRGALVGRRGMEHVAVSIFVRLLCGLVGEFARDGQISMQAHGTATSSGALML
jgi:hypothetical protein